MIRVLVVDDSAFVRKVLTTELAKFADIEVLGAAMDPYVAREMIAKQKPDVITLDIEMPRMDGLTFLEKLMRHHPIPVVILSSLTPENSALALQALELGAAEVLCKPGTRFSALDIGDRLVRAVRAAAQARPSALAARRPSAPAAPISVLLSAHQVESRVIAIGASTGGPRAVEQVLACFPAACPPVLIAQHMPPGFTQPFAARLREHSALDVREAVDGEYLAPGTALVAPAGIHMLVERSGARLVARLKDGPQVHFQKPAVDPLFQSLARHAGPQTVAAVLTGMGADGAAGLLALREAGARTIAQDEASSVVFGMPKEAIRLGGAEQVAPLDQIGPAILRWLALAQAA